MHKSLWEVTRPILLRSSLIKKCQEAVCVVAGVRVAECFRRHRKARPTKLLAGTTSRFWAVHLKPHDVSMAEQTAKSVGVLRAIMLSCAGLHHSMLLLRSQEGSPSLDAVLPGTSPKFMAQLITNLPLRSIGAKRMQPWQVLRPQQSVSLGEFICSTEGDAGLQTGVTLHGTSELRLSQQRCRRYNSWQSPEFDLKTEKARDSRWRADPAHWCCGKCGCALSTLKVKKTSLRLEQLPRIAHDALTVALSITESKQFDTLTHISSLHKCEVHNAVYAMFSTTAAQRQPGERTPNCWQQMGFHSLRHTHP